MPTAKQYVVIHPFTYRDPKTLKETHYEVGNAYSGGDVERYLDWEFPGPLIAEKTSDEAKDATEQAKADTKAGSDAGKEI